MMTLVLKTCVALRTGLRIQRPRAVWLGRSTPGEKIHRKFSIRALESESNGQTAEVLNASESPSSGGLLFGLNEVDHYHRILEDRPRYAETTFRKHELKSCLDSVPYKDDDIEKFSSSSWKASSVEEVLEAFRQLTSYSAHNNVPISNEKFNPICSQLLVCLPSFCDDSLVEFGKLLSLWPPDEDTYTKNFQSLFKKLDTVCVDRYKDNWIKERKIAQILKIAEIWYLLRLGRLNHYLRLTLFHTLMKLKEPNHIIQMSFYLSIIGTLPRSYQAYDIERKILSVKDSCSLEEMLVGAYGLFRTKKSLQNKLLVDELLERTIKEAGTMSDMTLAGCAKVLKSCVISEQLQRLDHLQTILVPRISQLSEHSISNVLWAGASNCCVNEEFVLAASNKFVAGIDQVRMKDYMRLLHLLIEYDVKGVDRIKVAEAILEQLNKPQPNIHYILYGNVLHLLLLCGVCPFDLIDKFLSTRTKVSDSLHAMSIEILLDVFFPDYKGARLDSVLREEVWNYCFGDGKGKAEFINETGHKGKRGTFNDPLVEENAHIVVQVVGGNEENVFVTNIVPSSGYIDIVLCVDKNGNYCPLPKYLRQYKPWEVKRLTETDASEMRFIALTLVRSVKQLWRTKITCLQQEKRRILQKLGYHLVEIHTHELKKFSVEQKIMLFEDRILKAIKV